MLSVNSAKPRGWVEERPSLFKGLFSASGENGGEKAPVGKEDTGEVLVEAGDGVNGELERILSSGISGNGEVEGI